MKKIFNNTVYIITLVVCLNEIGLTQWEWTTNGVSICTASGGQSYPKILSDGLGGAIITWQDSRSGNYDIYAQRVSSTGVVLWTTNGVSICTASGDQWNPVKY